MSTLRVPAVSQQDQQHLCSAGTVSIPSPAQWFKDLALPLHRSQDLIPALGISYVMRWPEKKKKNVNTSRSFEDIDSNPHRWLWGVQNFSGDSTTDVMEIAREWELWSQMWQMLQSHDKTLMDELLLMDEQKMWFLEMESTFGEDPVKTIEMTTKNLEHYINLIDKAAAGFERIDSNFERSSAVDKMLSNCIACPKEIIHEWEESFCAANFIFAIPTFSNHYLISQQPSASRQDPPPTKLLWLAEVSEDCKPCFSNKVFLN